MASNTEVRLTLGIEPERQPIAGWVEGVAGSRREFVGMLELIALLDRAREGKLAEVPGGGSGG